MDKKIIDHFKKKDSVLYRVALKVEKLIPIKKDRPQNYFYRLCREIVCQQLSDRAGMTIFGRFEKLFPKKIITVEKLLKTSHEKLRSAGMSHAKARYIRNLAEAIKNKSLGIDKLDQQTDEEVKKQLTGVKGIGPWTAEMFLMFVLARPDVFSHGDLGLRKALRIIYNLKKEPSKETVEAIVKKWSPYKTHACRLLWASLEAK